MDSESFNIEQLFSAVLLMGFGFCVGFCYCKLYDLLKGHRRNAERDPLLGRGAATNADNQSVVMPTTPLVNPAAMFQVQPPPQGSQPYQAASGYQTNFP